MSSKRTREYAPSCWVIANVRMAGYQPTKVQGIPAFAAGDGQEHIAIRVGRVLLIAEDRAALDALASAVQRAMTLSDDVFGPVEDEFDKAERRAEAARRAAWENGRRKTP